jgi:hypothetical protein
MGVSTQAHGTLCQWLIVLINLYAGRLDREGGVLPNDARAADHRAGHLGRGLRPLGQPRARPARGQR